MDFEAVFKGLEKKAKDNIFKEYQMPGDPPPKKPEGLFTEAEVRKMTMEQVRANSKKIDESRIHWNK